MNAEALCVENLSQRFGGIVALDRISFVAERGELFGIIGPNGAGKTTLLNCISGVYQVQEGTVRLGKERLDGRPPHRIALMGVARTFQAADFFAEMTLTDFLLLGRMPQQRTSLFACALGLPGVRRSERDERSRAHEMLDRFGLGHYAQLRVRHVPYGLRKLADVLRALLMEPSVLLLDEPTSGTTMQDREGLRWVLSEVRRRGITALMVDHDVRFVSEMCDRLLVMSSGKELGVGEPADVLGRRSVLEAYVGLED